MEKKRLTSLLLIVIFFFGTVLFGGLMVCSSENDIIEMFLPTETITLYPPITIVDNLHFEDGGTIGIIIRDTKLKVLTLCLDGRLPQTKESGPHYLFIGALHPDRPEAQRVPVGGKVEKAVLKMLQDISSRRISDSEKATVSMLIKKLENRQNSPAPKVKEQFK